MLTKDDLYSLEEYATIRSSFREEVVAHKKARSIALGDHVTILFEDRRTIQYQIQEMLRIERTFEPEGIQDELDAYNPLIPTGNTLKATMFIEYGNPEERKEKLKELAGIEHKVYVQVIGFDPVFAIADEDLERGDEDKTSAVHFLTFHFTPDMIEAFSDTPVVVGVTHDKYGKYTQVNEQLKLKLEKDFEPIV